MRLRRQNVCVLQFSRCRCDGKTANKPYQASAAVVTWYLVDICPLYPPTNLRVRYSENFHPSANNKVTELRPSFTLRKEVVM